MPGARGHGGRDAVVHLAAETSVLGSIERPAQVHARQRRGDRRAARAGARARRRGVRAGVHQRRRRRLRRHVHRGRPAAPADAVRRHEGRGRDAAVGLRRRLRHARPGAPADQRLRARHAGQGLLRPAAAARPRRATRASRCTATASSAATWCTSTTWRGPSRWRVADWPSGPTIIGSGTSVTVLDMLEAARAATGGRSRPSTCRAKPRRDARRGRGRLARPVPRLGAERCP